MLVRLRNGDGDGMRTGDGDGMGAVPSVQMFLIGEWFLSDGKEERH